MLKHADSQHIRLFGFFGIADKNNGVWPPLSL